MSSYIGALRIGLAALALLGALTSVTRASAQNVASEETVRSVRRMLERLPYYGVFDYIVFRVDRGTVYLAGYSFEGRLKKDAETATKRRAASAKWPTRLKCCPHRRTMTESAGRRSTGSTPMTSYRGTHPGASWECCKS